MEKVVGVRFRNVGKIYYFNPKNYKVKVGDHVIVETARGVEYGRVVLEPRSVREDEVVHPLKEVLRVATKEDEDHEAENRQKEKEAFKICKKKIREHGLEMKLIDAEYTFDNNKVLFILQRMAVLISGSWLRIWRLCLRPGSSFVRSVSVMRRRSLAVLVSVEGRFAVIRIFRSLRRFPSRWRRSKIFL